MYGEGFCVQGAGFRVQGTGFRVQGAGYGGRGVLDTAEEAGFGEFLVAAVPRIMSNPPAVPERLGFRA